MTDRHPRRWPTSPPTSTTPTPRGSPTPSRSGTTSRARARSPTRDRYGGVWLPTRHEDVSAIAYDTDHFTSPRRRRDRGPAARRRAPIGVAPPITSDPPFHHVARRLLLPAFAPRPIDALEPFTRSCCRDLLDARSATRRRRRRRRLRAAHPRARHRPACSGFPPEDDDLLPRLHPRRPRESSTADEERVRERRAPRRLPRPPHRTTTSSTLATTSPRYLLDAEIDGSR